MILGGSFFWAAPVSAQTPPNLPCRGCHGDNQRSLTLPSGETLPLLVSLDALDDSAHSYLNETPVSCTDCHSDAGRYRYPHATNPAQTARGYVEAAAENCEGCHYPHNPFHEDPPADESLTLPTCVDCHGAHDVAPLAELASRMPTNCVACHTGEEEGWAAALLAPRPGHGEGAAGIAGSARCLGCHADTYLSWRETLHANIVQDAEANPSVIMGNFLLDDADLTFGVDDVALVIGSRWRQQYITKTVEGNFELLPAQWNIATEEWVPNDHPDLTAGTEWRQACSGCHVTGLDTTRWEFTELGVGCESCHGPAEDHIADPENVKPYAKSDDQVCGACHSRGTSSEDLPFPASYQPGDTLSEHFTLTTDPEATWPDGSAKYNHQHYMDWQLGSSMMESGQVHCTTCHAVHDRGAATGQLRMPLNDLCLQCHNEREQQRIVRHMPYHEQAINKHQFLCTDCHMPQMATSAVPYDLQNHSFLQPNPQQSIDFGGVENMPNACNQCHQDYGEDPAWALQTIAYADQSFTPNAAAFFGAGPTPTSPPPPTPLPSVGQPVVHMQVETGRWLRITVFVLLGLMGVSLIGFGIYRIRMRSGRNA
ncbi:MAG TPA: cytochrome c3 family protein [Caldilineaceae bacterium]|nr:cytochrome c3 family protein [Caldilineaceae bacterium]